MSTWNVKCSLVLFAVTKDILQYRGNIRYMWTFAQMLIVASWFWNSSPRQKKWYQCKFWCWLHWQLFLDFSQLFFCNSTIRWEVFYPIIKKQFLFQYLAIQCFLVCFDTVGKHIWLIVLDSHPFSLPCFGFLLFLK